MLSYLICSKEGSYLASNLEYLYNFVIIRFLHWSPDCFHKKTHQRSTYDWGHEHWTCLPAARWWVRTQEVWEFVQWSGKEPQDSWNIKLWCFWYQFRGGKIIHFNYSTWWFFNYFFFGGGVMMRKLIFNGVWYDVGGGGCFNDDLFRIILGVPASSWAEHTGWIARWSEAQQVGRSHRQ